MEVHPDSVKEYRAVTKQLGEAIRRKGATAQESRGGEVADDSDVKKFLEATFRWDEWTVTMASVAEVVGVGLKEGRLVVPVEILITSVTDEPLFHARLIDPEANKTELLQSDESKWHSLEIYPVTATITDATGSVEEYEVDPRPKRVN